MDFGCFCRLSPNHTSLTYRNFVCQYLVMAETIVKQHVFAFVMFDSQHGVFRRSSVGLVRYPFHSFISMTQHTLSVHWSYNKIALNQWSVCLFVMSSWGQWVNLTQTSPQCPCKLQTVIDSCSNLYIHCSLYAYYCPYIYYSLYINCSLS